MNRKKATSLIGLTLLILTSTVFCSTAGDFLKTIFEQYPDAVAAELKWQSAKENYNAELLKSNSKLEIMMADLERLQAKKAFFDKKWEIVNEVFGILFELKKTGIEKNIADIEYKMYQEDLNNKKKALDYGGVSELDVALAGIEAEKSKAKLDYYKQIESEMEEYIKETLFVSEVPELRIRIEELQPISAEEINLIKEDNLNRKIENLQMQIEDTKYRLAQTGMTNKYLANVNKRSSKIHELREEAEVKYLFYELNLAFEKVTLSVSEYNAATEKKELYMEKLEKLQKAEKEGYITTYDYYQGVLDIYEYDRSAWKAEYDLFINLLSFLQAKGENPQEVLAGYFIKPGE